MDWTLLNSILEFVKPVLEGLLGKYGAAVTVLMYIGMLRLFIKPIMAFFLDVSKITPTPKDDELYKKIVESKTYKTVLFALDWLASIKLPKPTK